MEKGNGLVRVRSSASGRLIMVRVIAPGAVEPVLDAAPAGDRPADDDLQPHALTAGMDRRTIARLPPPSESP